MCYFQFGTSADRCASLNPHNVVVVVVLEAAFPCQLFVSVVTIDTVAPFAPLHTKTGKVSALGCSV